MSNMTVKESLDSSIDLSKIDSTGKDLKRHERQYREETPPRQSGLYAKNPSKSFSPIAKRDPEWKKKWLTSKNPCFHCGEVGHWAPDCPTRARVKGNQKTASVADIGVVPTLEQGKALLDSGAAHSVVGNLSLFSQLWDTDMTLSVASWKSYPVIAIGQIMLKTKIGTLVIDDVLYCKHIPGVILSIGQLLNQQIKVEFLDGIFSL
ncbi:hypothetical protein O181_119415 [Austropuccinia psidii MF-1]|uniref:CCHC-type domain-containing protein n=1 Tax=Austropuccinia psidii MF-1 TaxID=1389203 RepID=A0A9Q3KI78_9BASI|nr:hypothetical protein [Austropuccinia psidii MF-1]